MIALLDPRVWLVAMALMLGSYGMGRFQQWRSDEHDLVAATLKAREHADAVEERWQNNVGAINELHQAEIRRVAAARDAAMRKLRDRPERLPEAARAACAGATGAELSGRDSEVLAGIAARADELRASVQTCNAWIEEVRRPQP